MKLFHAQLILCKLIDTLDGEGAEGVSAFHQVITLDDGKKKKGGGIEQRS